MRIHSLTAGVLSLVLLARCPLTLANSVPLLSEDNLFRQAEFILESVVESTTYRNSDVLAQDQVPIPHAFVKLRILHIFKGTTTDPSTITLRFRGGPLGDGKILLVGRVPLFDQGDHDILFVRGNGSRIAPLVGWEEGRFRIFAGKVYSDKGEELWLARDGTLLYGKPKPLPEVTTNNLGGQVMTFERLPDKRQWTPPSGSVRLTLRRFRRYINTKLTQLPGSQAQRQAQSFEPTTSIDDEFSVDALEPAPPPR
jgi:hypothetical protein